MKANRKEIFVYAHWKGMNLPKLMGVFSAVFSRGHTSYSFEYDQQWIDSGEMFLLDPDLGFYSGQQYPGGKENFGVFLDSMPDTWGRTLMKRREAQIARDESRKPKTLYDIDYLLGVYDETRMGGLRFKVDTEGPFLDDSSEFPTPPWTSIKELQNSAKMVEADKESSEIKKWLSILMAPGSSLGGARPKANVLDENSNICIAKFPSKNDTIDKAAWEYLVYLLAIDAGIEMAESKIGKISGKHNTFITKRFDRDNNERIHFASAMTMTGNNENTIKDNPVSYLDIVGFIIDYCSNVEANLKQLWTRIVFNIAVSNTDDHLRNHGFIIKDGGWKLSPAYDINPSIDKEYLSLNIDENDSSLDFDLAISVGEYFRLNEKQMNEVIRNIKRSVSQWEAKAKGIGISKIEIDLMRNAFKC